MDGRRARVRRAGRSRASQLLYYVQLILISRNVPLSAVEQVL